MLLRLILLLAASPVRAQVGATVVTDPGLTAVQQMQTNLQKLHDQFMETQVVQDLVVLKNNYLAGKQYYDMIEEHSQHRGGLVGYYESYFQTQMDDMAEDQWRQLQTQASTISSGTWVQQLVMQGTSEVGKGTNVVIGGATGVVSGAMMTADGGYQDARALIYQQKQAHVAAVENLTASAGQRTDARKQQLALLIQRGGSAAMSSQERESIMMQSDLLQLEYLAEIQKDLNTQNDLENERQKEELEQSAVGIKEAADYQNFAQYWSQRAAAQAAGDNPGDAALLHELGRRPGEQ